MRLAGVFFLAWFLGVCSWPWQAAAQTKADRVVVYFFWGEGCGHCERAKPFLDQLEKEYPRLEVRRLESWSDSQNGALFQKMAAAYGTRAAGVPAFFVGSDLPVFGYSDQSRLELVARIKRCLEIGCPNPAVIAGIEVADSAATPAASKENLCLHLFFKPDCPHCQGIESFLDGLEKRQNVVIHKHNVSEEKGQQLYQLFKDNYGLTQTSFPVVFIGESYFIGQRSITDNLEAKVRQCTKSHCPCPSEAILGSTPVMPQAGDVTPDPNTAIELPFFGAVDLAKSPIFLTTLLIAFIDGFNPCSLWLIMFLLGIVIHSGSRRKILLVAATFLIVTASAYGLFMLGLLNVFMYVAYMKWITIAVAVVALIFAVVNIKDYFWFKKGLSFTIADKHKPGIFKKMRAIMQGERSTWGMMAGTATMALGVVLVELPCTAGFPVIWTNLLAQQQVQGGLFVALFATYLLVYLGIELVIIVTVVITLKASRFEEKHGRLLKLIGGLIMAALATVMLFAPELLNSLAGVLWVFALAGLAAAVILLLHRVILPKFGIVIGSEEGLVASPDQDKWI